MEWKESVKRGIIIGRDIYVQCITPISNLWRIPKWVQVTLIRNRCPQFYVAQGYPYQQKDQYDFYDIVKKMFCSQLDKQYAIKQLLENKWEWKTKILRLFYSLRKAAVFVLFIYSQFFIEAPIPDNMRVSVAKIHSWTRY